MTFTMCPACLKPISEAPSNEHQTYSRRQGKALSNHQCSCPLAFVLGNEEECDYCRRKEPMACTHTFFGVTIAIQCTSRTVLTPQLILTGSSIETICTLDQNELKLGTVHYYNTAPHFELTHYNILSITFR